MTPQHDEALRMLRLARRDHAAFAALIIAPNVLAAVALFHANNGQAASANPKKMPPATAPESTKAARGSRRAEPGLDTP